jgi:hypothetical protein
MRPWKIFQITISESALKEPHGVLEIGSQYTSLYWDLWNYKYYFRVEAKLLNLTSNLYIYIYIYSIYLIWVFIILISFKTIDLFRSDFASFVFVPTSPYIFHYPISLCIFHFFPIPPLHPIPSCVNFNFFPKDHEISQKK